MAEQAVIIYRTPDGRLIPVASDASVAPGWTPVAGPMLQSEANQQIQAMGGATQGQFLDSEMPQISQGIPGGFDWSSQAAQIQNKNRNNQQAARIARQSPTSDTMQSMGAASDYGQNIQTGGMDPYKFDNIRTGKLGETTPVPPGVTASQFNQDVYNTDPSGTGGGYNPSDPMNPAGYQSGGDWQAGSDPGMLDYTGMLAGGPQYTTEQLGDPAVMTERWLQSTTGDSFHANKGMLRDAYGSYGTLYGIQNGGDTIANPATQASMAGDWMTNFNGSTGGKSVDVNGLWDQTMGGYGDHMTSMSANADSSGQAQYQMVTDALGAMAPFMNPQAANMIEAQISNAWLDYNSMGANPSMTFIDYLRSIGADQWM